MTKKLYLLTLIILMASKAGLATTIELAANQRLELNDQWRSYKSKKILNKLSPYPLLEHVRYEGLMGLLATKVKFYNPKDFKTTSAWLENECSKLNKLYAPNGGDAKYLKTKMSCVVSNQAQNNTKEMIQYLKVKPLKNKGSSGQRVFIYTYSFYLPANIQKLKDDEVLEMKKAIHKLMEANI